MGKRLKGLVLMVCGVAGIVVGKILDMPALITILIVAVAVVAFIIGLAQMWGTSADKEKSSPSDKS